MIEVKVNPGSLHLVGLLPVILKQTASLLTNSTLFPLFKLLDVA